MVCSRVEALVGAVGPIIEGGRVERPEEGFAVTFPEDWAVRELTPEGHLLTFGSPEGEGDAPLPWTSTIIAYPPDGGEHCYITDITDLAVMPEAWASVDDAIAYLDADIEEILDLPAGPTAFTFGLYGEPAGMYIFTDADRWLDLTCVTTLDPPDDHWRSIAETFEFLPTKGDR